MKHEKYTYSEISTHISPEDAWIVIEDKVLDVTSWLPHHPGGPELLLEAAGKDVTEDFNGVGHSLEAREKLREFQIGSVRRVEGDEEVSGDLEGMEEGGEGKRKWGNWFWRWSAAVAMKRIGISALVIGVAFLARKYWGMYGKKKS